MVAKMATKLAQMATKLAKVMRPPCHFDPGTKSVVLVYGKKRDRDPP